MGASQALAVGGEGKQELPKQPPWRVSRGPGAAARVVVTQRGMLVVFMAAALTV